MKKKVLAKSTRAPKKLIKELMKREGKKSQVKIGDMREVVSKLGDILNSPAHKDKVLKQQLCNYLQKKHFDRYGIECEFDIYPMYNNYSDTQAVKKCHRAQMLKKSKALGERNGK